MSKLEELIKELCPDGVEYMELNELAEIVRGDRITKRDILPDGEYPILSGGQFPMGRYDRYNRKENTITIASYGAAGYVGFQEEKFWANDVCLCVFPKNEIDNKFLYYYLKSIQNYLYSKTTKAIPDHIPTSVIQSLQIPLPPLAVQREIVRILDNYTQKCEELKSTLSVELAARKKQYNFYRDSLLTFNSECVIRNAELSARHPERRNVVS